MMEDPSNSDPIQPGTAPTEEQIAAYIRDQINSIRNQLQPPVRVKPAKPRGYSADRGSDPDVWLFQFEQYAELMGLADSQKVQLAATYLEGPVAVWWRSVATQLQNQVPPNNVLTWGAFKQQLVGQFKPIDSTKMARDQLANLKQMGSVQRYNTEFNRLVLEAGNVGPVEALDRYTRGLKPEIRMEVELANITSVQQAQVKAQRVDSITWQSHSGGRPFYPPALTNSSYAPMDISTIQSIGTPKQDTGIDNVNTMVTRINRPRSQQYAPPMTREEFQRCRKNGLCLKCKKPGHTARFCLNIAAPQRIGKPSGNEQTR
jgi:hypothetical protein